MHPQSFIRSVGVGGETHKNIQKDEDNTSKALTSGVVCAHREKPQAAEHCIVEAQTAMSKGVSSSSSGVVRNRVSRSKVPADVAWGGREGRGSGAWEAKGGWAVCWRIGRPFVVMKGEGWFRGTCRAVPRALHQRHEPQKARVGGVGGRTIIVVPEIPSPSPQITGNT